MKKTFTSEELEKKILGIFKKKSDIFFGENNKEIFDTIYPMVKAKIVGKYFPEKEVKFIKELSKEDQKRYKQLKMLAKIHMENPKEREKAINTVLVLAKDIKIFLTRILELLVRLDLKTEASELLKNRSNDMLYMYAPIAASFGFHKIKVYLENSAFSYLLPNERKKIDELIKERYPHMESMLKKIMNDIEKHIRGELKDKFEVKVSGRIKTPYSIFRKMNVKNIPSIDRIYDLIAIRVTTEEYTQCYEVLGQIHSLYQPMTNKVKDYIVKPKANRYQSIHTIVLIDKKMPVEIQIRTREMHRYAEYGPAAHSIYKLEKGTGEKQLKHLKEILNFASYLPSMTEWSETLDYEFEEDIISVFTPKGDIIELPTGSTPIDFAYALKTDIGDHSIIAKIDGRSISLDTELENGQTVEIITKMDVQPNIFWLSHAKTQNAREKIKRFLRSKSDPGYILEGRKILDKNLKEHGLETLDDSYSKLKKWNGKTLSIDEREYILEQIYSGTIDAHKLIHELFHDVHRVIPKSESKDLKTEKRNRIIIDSQSGIMNQLAKCCNPKTGDEIIGYASFKGYISIHKKDCPNITDLPENNFIQVHWDE